MDTKINEISHWYTAQTSLYTATLAIVALSLVAAATSMHTLMESARESGSTNRTLSLVDAGWAFKALPASLAGERRRRIYR